MEEWIQIDTFKKYNVSSHGNIQNRKTKRLLTLTKSDDGYLYVTLYGDDKIYKNPSVHTLVCKAFHSNPLNKPTVNHKNMIRTDNHKDNLEWSSYSEQNLNKKKNNTIAGTKIWKCDMNTGQKIQLYDSIRHALESVNEINVKQTYKITKNMDSAYGFKWKYDNEELENEIWHVLDPKFINNIEGYSISNYGRIKNNKNKIFDGNSDMRGYRNIKIGNSNINIHTLMGKVFFSSSENNDINMVINHKDGNKSNNKLENLELITQSENIKHAYVNGLITKLNKRSVIQVDYKFNVVKEYDSLTEAETITGINRGVIHHAIKNNNVGHGFRWFSTLEQFTKEKETLEWKKTFFKVIQCSKSGEFLDCFDSYPEAYLKTGVSKSNISRSCKEQKAYAGGFKWFQNLHDYENYDLFIK